MAKTVLPSDFYEPGDDIIGMVDKEQQWVQGLKDKSDIVAVFEKHGVKLAKQGKGYMGLCPFHDDKNPSLSVDAEKKVFHCFGCRKKGDLITAVRELKGASYKEAVAWLDREFGSGHASGRPAPGRPAPKRVAKIVTMPVAATAVVVPPTIDLDAVVDHYHRSLTGNQAAMDYLAARGLANPELIARFRIGFASGDLSALLGEADRAWLIEAGVLHENAREHLHGCITVPLFDDRGKVAGFYGRRITDEAPHHLYLRGKHRGLVNRGAARAFRDGLILTESVIDALSLVAMGMDNVIPCYGTSGFTDEHRSALKDEVVKTLIIAFDSDEAGKSGSEKLKEKLVKEGFEVKTIVPPNKKDWNEELVKGLTRETVKRLIDESKVTEVEKDPDGFEVVVEHNRHVFRIQDLTYRVAGVRELWVTSLKLNIRVEHAGVSDVDNVDLYAARSRKNFAEHFSEVMGVSSVRILRDLGRIREHLETERDRVLLAANPQGSPEVSAEDRSLAMRFLTNVHLFDEIVNDLSTLGYVGEDANKKLLYLAASSRILDDPISVMILSQSSSGKSMLVDTVKKLIPEEDLIAVTSLSDQALNYVASLVHKFLVMGEAVHNELIEHQVREMLSGKELSRLVTMKDEKTGKLESRVVKTPAVVSCVMSSTRNDINPENSSRFFLVNTDESREQTRRIHAKQREKYTVERYREKEHEIPVIVRKHHAAQRLLQKHVIVNRFAHHLDFPDTLMRVRRDHDRFIDLIAVVAFQRQYLKEVKFFDDGKSYVECDIEDYRIAYELMVHGVLASTMVELPRGAVELYDALRELARTRAREMNLGVTEIEFTQRSIRDTLGFGHTWVRENLKLLVEYEYVDRLRGTNRGERSYYRLKEDRDVGQFDLSMIPDPGKMAALLADGVPG